MHRFSHKKLPISLAFLAQHHRWKSIFMPGSPRNSEQKFWICSTWKVSSLKNRHTQPCTKITLAPYCFYVTQPYFQPATYTLHHHSSAKCPTWSSAQSSGAMVLFQVLQQQRRIRDLRTYKCTNLTNDGNKDFMYMYIHCGPHEQSVFAQPCCMPQAGIQ